MHVYVKRNTTNGKHYVGQVSQEGKTTEGRWEEHLKDARCGSKVPFHCAIRKYGPEAFQTVMECKVENKALLDAAEAAFIVSFHSRVEEHGYNLTDGGEGCAGYKFTEEQRLKLCKPKSEEHRRKHRGEAAHNAKLTHTQVREMREAYTLDGISLRALTTKYGVVKSVVSRIVNYEHWTEGTDPNLSGRNPRAKLTSALVSEIREEYALGATTQVALARKYGVSKQTVCFIIHNQTWKLREAQEPVHAHD